MGDVFYFCSFEVRGSDKVKFKLYHVTASSFSWLGACTIQWTVGTEATTLSYVRFDLPPWFAFTTNAL